MEKFDAINELRKEEGKRPCRRLIILLLCNKICGSSHYNMQMKVIVEEEEEFNNWLKQSKNFSPGNHNNI